MSEITNLVKPSWQRRDHIIFGNEPIPIEPTIQLRIKQIETLVRPNTLNAKYSPGALVGIEYGIQFLQLLHGHDNKEVRTPGTLKTMERLLEQDIISASTFEKLSNGYAFWRRLINALRMVRGNAKDLEIPGYESQEFLYLARRLHYTSKSDFLDIEQLKNDIDTHRQFIDNFYQQTFIDKKPVVYQNQGLAELIINPNTDIEMIQSVLGPYPFKDKEGTYKTLHNMYVQNNQPHRILSVLVLSCQWWLHSPDPDKVLYYLERFFQNATNEHLQVLFYEPNACDLLISIFGHSEYLSDKISQNPQYLDFLIDMVHSKMAAPSYIILY